MSGAGHLAGASRTTGVGLHSATPFDPTPNEGRYGTLRVSDPGAAIRTALHATPVESIGLLPGLTPLAV